MHPPGLRNCHCIWQSKHGICENYANGSSIDRGVGAAAVLFINDTAQQPLQHYLGSEKHHTVYEAELVGLVLAAALLQQLKFLEDVSITIDNQAAIKVMTNHCSTPGPQLIDFFLNQMTEIARQHQGVPIKIHWIPGHKEILGNEEAEKLAKQAAMQQGDTASIIPSILRLSLPHSKTAHKTNFYKQIKEDAGNNFQKSTRYDRMHVINPKAPSHNYRELTATLTQCQSSILMELCTGHTQLNRHLYNIGTTATPICPTCNRQEETVRHYLLSCMAHVQHWTLSSTNQYATERHTTSRNC